MPMVGGNPENLRADLQEQALATNAEADKAEAEAAKKPKEFDPVQVVRQMHALPSDDDSELRALVQEIREHGGYAY